MLNREICCSQSMNYYPTSNIGAYQGPRPNMYNYQYNNYDFGSNLSTLRPNMPYLSPNNSNSDHMIVEMQYDKRRHVGSEQIDLQQNQTMPVNKSAMPNNYFDLNYPMYSKYCPLPKSTTNYQTNQMFPTTSDLSQSRYSDPSCIPHYSQYPQFFPNDGQSIFYDQPPNHLNEHVKSNRMMMHNCSNLDQDIYHYEARLQFLSQNPSKNPNYIHEFNEVKEKLIYFKQLKEKSLVAQDKTNYCYVNKFDTKDQQNMMNCYNPQSRSEGYGFPQSNIQSVNHRLSGRSNQYESYGNLSFPQSINHTSSTVNTTTLTDQEKTFFEVLNQSTSHTSFVSELIGDDSQLYNISSNASNNNIRDELSTPPIVEITDLNSVISNKSTHSSFINTTATSSSQADAIINESQLPVISSVSDAFKPQIITDNSYQNISHQDESVVIHQATSSPLSFNESSKSQCFDSDVIEQSSNYALSDTVHDIQLLKDEQESITYPALDESMSENNQDFICDQNLSCSSEINNEVKKENNEIYDGSERISSFSNSDPKCQELLISSDFVVNNRSLSDDFTMNIPENNPTCCGMNDDGDLQNEDIIEEGNQLLMESETNSCTISDDISCQHPKKDDESDINISESANVQSEFHLSNELSSTLDLESNSQLHFSETESSLNENSPDIQVFSSEMLKVRLREKVKPLKKFKWLFRCKKYYFHLKVKMLINKLFKKRKVKSNQKSSSLNCDLIEKSEDIVDKKRPVNRNNINRRMKNVRSFLRKRMNKGSYFNNSEYDDLNIPRKILRSVPKLQVTTRPRGNKIEDTMKDINADLESVDESSSTSSDENMDSIFELNLDNGTKIVHKILGTRLIRASDISDSIFKETNDNEVEEYYLKYKGYSYIHCEWKSVDSVDDPTFSSKIKRYKNMKMNSSDEPDDFLFNPDYVEIDRVLDLKEVEIVNNKSQNENNDGILSKESITFYLVKWRSLPYEEITWEKSENVDPNKVKEFQQRMSFSYSENVEINKPTHAEWKPISTERVYKNTNKLRDYQLEGVNWLTFCWLTSRNCILADEMGLGKTVQSIALLLELSNYGFRGPFLVIVPLSTLGNWQREFEHWSDFNVIVYHGSAKSRYIIQNYEIYSKSSDLSMNRKLIFNAIVTTYEVLISDLLFFSKFQWTAAIIDEAHRLKNKRCKLFEGLKMLDLRFRVLLTGTPLQNNVQELFNLLNFLEPSKFFSESDFLLQYGDLRSEEQVASLKSLLKPMMLRRLKEDVEKSLAPKEEIIVEVELTNIQKKYYRAILERNFSFLSKGAAGNNVPNLMNTMMELRKCCNHPFLIKGAEDAILDNLRNGSDMGNIFKYMQNRNADEETLQFYAMVYASGKLVFIHKLLPKLKQNGHKVLIFSQMVRVLDILEDYLIYEKYHYERIDGRIHGLLRQEAIDRFSSDQEKFVFLLCTKAGGLGINLTAADVVIIFDSDWNPQNDLQAQARCHRIGQQKLVNVYRLITRNTYEREMFDRASLKLGLDKAILQSMTYTESKTASQLSKKEIEDLLKLGAYGALMDDDKDGEKFCEEDIEKILNSRSTVIRLNSTEKNSSFSKASFSISDNRSDIKLDDPNFWQKWAKKAGVDESDICNSLIMDKPRLRRQTNRYKPNCTLYDEMSGDDSNSSVLDSSKSRYFSNKSLKNKKKSLRNSSSTSLDEMKDGDAEDSMQKGNQDMDRYDLFKAEKCLLQFGWERWEYSLEKLSFKVPISVKELESLCRTILQYAHRHYSGDDRIYSFIEDLLQPDSDSASMKQHLGYSAPVARGRRGRRGIDENNSVANKKEETKSQKKNTESCEDNNIDEEQSDVFTNISTPLSLNGDNNENDPEFSVLVCPNFRKHIQRTSHKLLHRIQFLYFLNHEIVGSDRAKLILSNIDYRDIPDFPDLKSFTFLDNDHLPSWWNTTVDKCLLLGIFKHGWEKYDDIFKDNSLGFPDWLVGSSYPVDINDSFSEKTPKKELPLDMTECALQELDDSLNSKDTEKSKTDCERKDDFPSNSELNIRLRKIIGSFQKLWRQKESEKNKIRSNGHFVESTHQESGNLNEYRTTKWSRREETEFYRAINSFGIEKLPNSDEIVWKNFRNVSNLPRKSDESLTVYFKAFYTMCQKICQKYPFVYEDEHNIEIENISSERANRCLVKINLMSKIRNEILHHPELQERIKLCESTNDLPSWWIPGHHDLSLLRGISKYGATRTELAIINDVTFGFKETIMELLKKHVSKVEIFTESTQPNKSENMKITEETNPVIKADDSADVSQKADSEVDESILMEVCSCLLDEMFETVISEVTQILMEAPTEIKNEKCLSTLDKSAESTLLDIAILSKVGWPKERALFSRLELIAQTVEKGVWPFAKNPNVYHVKAASLFPDRNPESDLDQIAKEEVSIHLKNQEVLKVEPQESTFKPKRRGRKKMASHFMSSRPFISGEKKESVCKEECSQMDESNIRAAYEAWSSALMSAALSSQTDPSIMMQKMFQMASDFNSDTTLGKGCAFTNTDETMSSKSSADSTKVKMPTDSLSIDVPLWNPQRSSMKLCKSNVRRGRRPKHIGLFEERENKSMVVDNGNPAAVAFSSSTNPSIFADVASSNPDTIIPVINVFDGKLIYDETAPKRKDLESFLIRNPNFMPYSIEEEDQKIFNKVAKSRGQDTSPLYAILFNQYMSFVMSTMVAPQMPYNMYNAFFAGAGDDANKAAAAAAAATGDAQLQALSMYMQYLSFLSSSTGGQPLPDTESVVPIKPHSEQSQSSRKRTLDMAEKNSIGGASGCAPAKVKSYSISHLTDSGTGGSSATDCILENTIPAHSNQSDGGHQKSMSTTENNPKSPSETIKNNIKLKSPAAGVSSNNLLNNNSINPNSSQLKDDDVNSALATQNSSDILAAYQAYMYSAMLYTDYISYMQQCSLLNNNGSNNSNSNNNKSAESLSDFISGKLPPPAKDLPIGAIFNNSTNNNSNNNNNNQSFANISSAVVPPTPTVPNKKARLGSFSVESMGITVTTSNSQQQQQPINTTSVTTAHNDDSVVDDSAVLDLSNR